MDEFLTPDQFREKYGEIKLNSRGRLTLPREKKPSQPKVMNSAEKYFSEQYLNPRQFNWSFEGMKLLLGDGTKYTPDFVEFTPEGRVFYEVKEEAANGFKGWTFRATLAKMHHAKSIIEHFGMRIVLATLKGSKKAGTKRIEIREI